MDHFRRMSALRRKMHRAGLPGLLITFLPDVRYLCGFTGSSAALAITRRRARLFTDSRYTTQAAEEAQGAEVHIVHGAPAIAAAQWLAAQPGVHAAGFDPARTTVAELKRWKSELPGSLRRSFLAELPAPFVEQLRMVKDEDELTLVAEAALLGCRLFEGILGLLRPGIAEIDVAAELEHEARPLGADGMSFETIVAGGERSALPHGRASVARLPKRGFVTLDFGIIHKGYCSDMTRTVFLGTPKLAERKAYQAVLEAQENAIRAVAPGVSCAEVDEAARGILRGHGLGDAFSHSTGHGVGLEIHEPPRLGVGQRTLLVPGMVVTIEPGIYLPGQFGIRIEDMVAVTRTAGQVLTPSPKALVEL